MKISKGEKVKKFLFVPVLLVMLFWSASIAGSAGSWTKYVAADGSYSFHYPSGWKVKPVQSLVIIENVETDEGLLMAGVPYDSRKSPAVLATGFINLLKDNSPNVRAFNWQTEPKTKDSQVLFDLVDQNNDKSYSGLGMVIKTEQQATWFSYFAPAVGYSKERGLAILQGLISSLATGSASKMPAFDYTTDLSAKIDRNAQAFMFVLEFALGAPFTEAQERLILDELKSGWKDLSETELKKYDQYPPLVQTILKMGQKDLAELRAELEKTIKAWLAESDSSDKAVKVIHNHLQARGRVMIAGEPPLTEMSLTAYSEIIVFSRLLHQNPQVSTEQISQDSVNEIKKIVLKTWRSFSPKEQQGIATSPGLWICLRVLLRDGSQAEQEKIRNQLLKLSPETGSTNSTVSSGNQKALKGMLMHNSLMAIQQQTFNQYMWSRGFSYQPATGRMW